MGGVRAGGGGGWPRAHLCHSVRVHLCSSAPSGPTPPPARAPPASASANSATPPPARRAPRGEPIAEPATPPFCLLRKGELRGL